MLSSMGLPMPTRSSARTQPTPWAMHVTQTPSSASVNHFQWAEGAYIGTRVIHNAFVPRLFSRDTTRLYTSLNGCYI